LQTGLRLCNRNATMTSTKWKGSYDSGLKYRSEWDVTFFIDAKSCPWISDLGSENQPDDLGWQRSLRNRMEEHRTSL